MDELEIIKALADLDGIDVDKHDKKYFTKEPEYNGWIGLDECDPLKDFNLAYQAMIKYSVRIMGHKIYIDSMRNKSTVVNEDINNPLSVAKSIIECILKHNNLWSEK